MRILALAGLGLAGLGLAGLAHGFRLSTPRVTRSLHAAPKNIAASAHDADEQVKKGMSLRRNHRRAIHAEYYTRRDSIEIVVAEHVDDYRAAVEVRTALPLMIRSRATTEAARCCVCSSSNPYPPCSQAHVRPDDVALEVGCAGGVTTAALGRCARLTYGIDKSISTNMQAEQQSFAQEHIKFMQLDAMDMGALLKLNKVAAEEAERLADDGSTDGDAAARGSPPGFTVILIDISGSAKLSAVLDLVEVYETCFRDSLRLLIVKSFRFACLLDRARPFEST